MNPSLPVEKAKVGYNSLISECVKAEGAIELIQELVAHSEYLETTCFELSRRVVELKQYVEDLKVLR